MVRKTKTDAKPRKKPIEQYEHKGKERLNNPPVGLVDAHSEAAEGRKKYAYDPHLDPTLQWAGKAERTSFEIPTVSLHVHERIDPRTILETVRKKNGSNYEQLSLFSSKAENPPLREAIAFYRHKHGWSNRLIAGDSLLVMNSLLEKEGLSGQVQMVYIDPPYGIRYGSNFQPFVNKRDVKDGKDEDLTAEPEMIKAFRDTWELGIHSYLSYLRDRLLLVRELLAESGSVFVQIGDENVHRARAITDEVFGSENFVAQISFKATDPLGQKGLARVYDYIIWYGRDKPQIRFRPLYRERNITDDREYRFVDEPSAQLGYRKLSEVEFAELDSDKRIFRRRNLTSSGFTPTCTFDFEFHGKNYPPPGGKSWSTNRQGMERLKAANRIFVLGKDPYFKQYNQDFPWSQYENCWTDKPPAIAKAYVVETAQKFIQRCLLMTSDPGDLVLDITCGSGTTACVAEQWGRRWITCDTSRVALTLAKQRLMTAVYDYYELAHPDEGVSSGFVYKTVPHVTLKSIANNEPPDQETLYDQPPTDNSKTRVTGPFTVEAVPAPMVKSPAELNGDAMDVALPADESVARSGETLRQNQWRSELLRSGIRGKGGQMILFSRVEPLAGTRWLHAEAETKPNGAGRNRVREGAANEVQRVVISFGPEHAPLEQKQVEMAFEESRKLVPRPQIIVFAAFQFDPEAAKDIDETKISGITLLKVQMNADLLTEDLKKKRSSNESFWLIGQPDVTLKKSKVKAPKTKANGEELWQVEIHGFDYYNTKTGTIESGGSDKIAMWMLDTDYDGRSLFPRQVFFPMSGEKDCWSRLARNLRAEIDEELIESFRGTVSLPFAAGKHSRVAVKIVDDRGIESLKILEME